MVIAWFTLAWATEVVITLDNGGFNLPLYTGRWNGEFERPSVARQFVADVARVDGANPRVFTYLPPGRAEGNASDPHEVLPVLPGCEGPGCECAPGQNCWAGVDVNRHPAASTSLYQAASAARRRVEGPRIEVHLTDLFEEDPASTERAADADRCVTTSSTQRALEAMLQGDGHSVDHLSVGLLRANIQAPRRPEGGLVRFEEREGGCWSGRRAAVFGGGADTVELDMGVVIVGLDTARDDARVQAFIEKLQRQMGDGLRLDLVTVREPGTVAVMPPHRIGANNPVLELPPPIPRSTPCDSMAASTRLWSGGRPIVADVRPTCDATSFLSFDRDVLSASFREQAGLNPTVGSLEVGGEIALTGDLDAIRHEVERLAAEPASDRPLPHWGSLVEALRFDGGGAARGRSHRIRLEGVTVEDVDDRPWMMVALFSIVPLFLGAGLCYMVLARMAASRAYRRHLDANAAEGRPLAMVLAEASEEASEGWTGRLMISLAVGGASAAASALVLLLLEGLLLG